MPNKDPAADANKLTKEQQELLGTKPDAVLAEEFGVDKNVVWRARNYLGKPKCPSDWKLKPHHDLMGTMHDMELAEKIGVTKTQVFNYRRKHNIPKYTPRVHTIDWTKIDWTKNNHDIAKALNQQSNRTFTHKDVSRMRTKIGAPPAPRRQTKKQIRVNWPKYEHLFGTMPDAELADIIGCSETAISWYRKNNPEKNLPVHDTYAVIDWSNLDWDNTSDTTLAHQLRKQHGIRIDQHAVWIKRQELGHPAFDRTIKRFEHLKPTVKELLGTGTDRDIAQQTNTTIFFVKEMRKQYNVPNYFEQYENKILANKHLFETMYMNAIAEQLEVPANTVYRTATKYNIETLDWCSQLESTDCDEYLGKIPDLLLAKKYNVSTGSIQRRRSQQDIPPFQGKFLTRCNHSLNQCEAIIDEYYHKYNINHNAQYKIPRPEGSYYLPDWYLPDTNTVVEFVGTLERPDLRDKYKKRLKQKLQFYHANGYNIKIIGYRDLPSYEAAINLTDIKTINRRECAQCQTSKTHITRIGLCRPCIRQELQQPRFTKRHCKPIGDNNDCFKCHEVKPHYRTAMCKPCYLGKYHSKKAINKEET